MASKNSINENDLNELLRGLYLDENSKIANEKEAQFVLKQEYKVKTNPAREMELINKLNSRPSSFANYKLFLSFLIIALTILFFVLPKKNPEPKGVHAETAGNTNTTSTSMFRADETANILIAEKETQKKKNESIFIQQDTFGRMALQKSVLSDDSIASKTIEPTLQSNPVQKIPIVSEPDKIRYKKIKLLMLKKLYSADKTLYTHIDADKMDYNGAPTIIEAFSLRNMGVTNLEYKTFLADLLMQNKNEEYLVAQVLNSNWSVYGYNNLATTYFQEDKYNDFPVVNISIAGAKLFCNWLEEECAKYMKANNVKSKPLQVRLPYDIEWLYAARTGYTTISFEKGYNTIFDAEEGMTDKSYDKRIELVKKKSQKKDTLYSYITMSHYGWNEKEIIELFTKALTYYPLSPADTINSARMKTYGKLAHVSEMINEKKSEKVWFIGSSWKTKEDYLKLQNEFQTVKASPFVGFRPVVINSSDPEYKNPFW